MEDEKAPTVATVSASKLLNYVKKDELIEFMTRAQYEQLKTNLQQTLGKQKISLSDMKKNLKTNEQFITALRSSPFGKRAFDRYIAGATRLRSVDKARAKEVRKVMKEPRNRFLGCLATKLDTTDYQTCLDTYDNPDYARVKMVPSALKERVYETGDADIRRVLAPSVVGKKFTDLPSGLRSYIVAHPQEFKNYFQERRMELGMLKAVLRNLTNEQKETLRRHYQASRTLTADDFSRVLGGPTRQKRRTAGPGAAAAAPTPGVTTPTVGGHRTVIGRDDSHDDYDVEEYDTDEESESLNEVLRDLHV